MLLSDQITTKDKKGKFVKINSYIYRSEYWFRKLDRINKKTTEEITEKIKDKKTDPFDRDFYKYVLNFRNKKED